MTSSIEIPLTSFGQDHWSTFTYLKTRAVDHCGRLNPDNLRIDRTRHEHMIGRRKAAFGGGPCGSKYPTRIAGNVEVKGHDDWDCLLDIERAGLIVVERPPAMQVALNAGYGPVARLWTGLMEREVEQKQLAQARIRLTPLGEQVAGQLRAHRGRGHNYRTFRAQEEP